MILKYFQKVERPNKAEQNNEASQQQPSQASDTKADLPQSPKSVRPSQVNQSPQVVRSPQVTRSPSVVKSPQSINSPRVALTPRVTQSPQFQLNQTPRSIKSPRVPQSPQVPQSPRVGLDSISESASADEYNHLHLTYKFLYPPQRRDINKRPPDHPDYDERTLHLPESFLNSQTPALRQWWLIKQKNMDAVLFFKMGKFYELFNEDAVIAVNNLDIIYMKGDETKPAHAGFPEVSYEKYSKMLIEKGYKVMRIEQTETPAMMEDRCARTGQRAKFDKIVKREVCRITTKGTQMLGTMESVFHSSQNQYLMAICETITYPECSNAKSTKVYGVCFVDVTTNKLYIGQFEDDSNLSKLNILLAHHKPTEVLFERGNISQMAYQSLLRTGASLTPLRSDREFWPIKKAITHLKTNQIFSDEPKGNEWPRELKSLFQTGMSSENLVSLEPKEEFKHGLNSFGAIVFYLQSQMIVSQVLQCVTIELYIPPLDPRSTGKLVSNTIYGAQKEAPMIMDHVALRNLEIFESYDGSTTATLYSSINHCKTHFGQRLLKNWICSPLQDIKQLNNRLDAVEALVSNENASLMNEIAHMLSPTPDLERLLSRIKSQCFKSDSDNKAIMFDNDQYSKAKISSFLNLLQNFKRIRKFISSVQGAAEKSNSDVLKRLMSFTTDDGLFPDYSSTIEYFDSAFDHETAKKTGQIIPGRGVDMAYDKCLENQTRIKSQLDEYLEDQKEILHPSKRVKIEFFGTAKNRYQIQVPEEYCKNVPRDYRIETTRKGYKRYYTPVTEKLLQELTVHEEEMKKILDGIMSRIFEQFVRKLSLWSKAIDCVAILDVLQSIASFVRSLKANDVPVCRPMFIERGDQPILEYTDGRHPALVKADPNYIANDLKLDQRLVLLSGANMGGKSTLMRQTALLVVLAQIGCYVPASSMRLSTVDRIFSRLGASDRLLEGESTFYTELIETSVMIRHATKNSLLLLDELGRGTSTFDGTAIAYSVIQEISSNIRCRCLFSTHYHSLIEDFEGMDDVRLAHMACKIERESDDSIDLDPLKENITFLYKISEGPVARSYGFNVAKLAGISDNIIREAFKKAQEMQTVMKRMSAL